MPAKNEEETGKKEESSTEATTTKKDEDPLKGLVPLGPLGLFSGKNGANKPTHQLPFSSKIDQFSTGTTIANPNSLFQGGSIRLECVP